MPKQTTSSGPVGEEVTSYAAGSEAEEPAGPEARSQTTDVVVIDGPMPRSRTRRTQEEMYSSTTRQPAIESANGSGITPWRYPEIYQLQPGQSLLYRWERFRTLDPPKTIGVLMRQIRRQRGWSIRSSVHPEGIWVERRG